MDSSATNEKIRSERLDASVLVYVIVFVGLITYVVVQRVGITRNAEYTKGVISNIDEGVRGNIDLHFYFFAKGKQYKGVASVVFCNQCRTPCCHQGDSVLVRFEKGNPENNDLLHELPKGATLNYETN